VAARRFTRPGRTFHRHRTRTDWARIVPVTPIAVAGGGASVISTFVLSNPGIGETIRRTRGLISVTSDQDTILEEINGAVGMVVVSDAAAAVGIAALPTPVTDASDDGWFVWIPFSQTTVGTNATAVAAGLADVSVRYPYDSKAMRRVEEGSTIVVIAELASSNGCEVYVNTALLSSPS